MYLLSALNNASVYSTKVIAASSLHMPTNIDMWHHCFCHARVMSILNMLQKGLIDGLVVKSSMETKGVCEDCMYRKHATCSYNTKVEPETHPNQCIHIDLWGPASVVSLGGASYLMLTADSATSWLTSFFLSQKDTKTTFEAFKAYYIESEWQMGRKLCMVRVDAGWEWINEVYCSSHSIYINITTPYAHTQNRLAKRSKQQLKVVRCMLADRGLPKSLWAKVAATQIHILSAQYANLVPEEGWSKK